MKGTTNSCGCIRSSQSKLNSQRAQEYSKENILVENTSLSMIKPNKKLLKNNTSGHIGVTWDKSRKKWLAQIVFKGTTYHLGRFDDIEDAIKAREEAEKIYFKPILDKYK